MSVLHTFPTSDKLFGKLEAGIAEQSALLAELALIRQQYESMWFKLESQIMEERIQRSCDNTVAAREGERKLAKQKKQARLRHALKICSLIALGCALVHAL